MIRSTWTDGVYPIDRPRYSKREKARKLVKQLESGELSDSKKFMRDIYNSIKFFNLPDEFLPQLDD